MFQSRNRFKGARIIVGHLTSEVLRSAAFHDQKDNCKPKKPNEKKTLRPGKKLHTWAVDALAERETEGTLCSLKSGSHEAI